MSPHSKPRLSPPVLGGSRPTHLRADPVQDGRLVDGAKSSVLRSDLRGLQAGQFTAIPNPTRFAPPGTGNSVYGTEPTIRTLTSRVLDLCETHSPKSWPSAFRLTPESGDLRVTGPTTDRA